MIIEEEEEEEESRGKIREQLYVSCLLVLADDKLFLRLLIINWLQNQN